MIQLFIEGGVDKLAYLITAGFIVLDFVTGIVKAFKQKEFSSSVMRAGLFNKVGSVLCITLGALVDYAQQYIDIGVTLPVAKALCTYVILMEIGSTIENVCKISPDIMSSKIKSYFSKLTDKE